MKNQNTQIVDSKKIENLKQLKVGNMYVEIEYSEDNKSFEECMLNILKLKLK